MEKDFVNNQLPYEKLSMLGIDRQKADLLPQDVRTSLSNGELTPLLKVSIDVGNGQKITLPLKLQMVQDKDGRSLLYAYPVRTELDLTKDNPLQLSNNEREALRNGNVLNKSIEIEGQKIQHYIQLDPETKSVLMHRISDLKIEHRLKDIEKVNDIELGSQQKQAIREGKPMELNVGGEKVTVGIDLKEPQGFRVVNGDMKEWERHQKIKYDELHPEYLGLVMTDKNRWEYQQVVDRQSTERAITLNPDKNQERKSNLKNVKSSVYG